MLDALIQCKEKDILPVKMFFAGFTAINGITCVLCKYNFCKAYCQVIHHDTYSKHVIYA